MAKSHVNAGGAARLRTVPPPPAVSFAPPTTRIALLIYDAFTGPALEKNS